jgi:phenylpropionate dioxygenase-like ring-hydroxylating dioxygenase large terminal subunit
MVFKKLNTKRISERIQYRSQEARSMEEDFVKVAETKDVQISQMMAVEVNGEKVCIANIEGRYYAIGNVCTHMGGPLAEGKIEGFEVQCPWTEKMLKVMCIYNVNYSF